MYSAIVFLPLLGFLLAGAASMFAWKLGANVAAFGAADHSGHGHHASHHHDDHHHAVEPSPHSDSVNRFSEYVTTALLFVSCALSWFAFFEHNLGTAGAITVPVANWISSGALQVAWSLRIDALTGMMLIVVTTVSALVHLYSIGYMQEDPHKPRFFAYLSLFTFAMLMLVTSDNLVQMFFGWEGVGLASYLLIGFWFKKQSARDAAMKAFIVNRVGDFGFALGIFLVFWLTGSVGFDQIFAAAPGLKDAQFNFIGIEGHALTIACILLFMGAMGKSAQFMLHTWLPDAMEGPTPVSALIHAATMVTAGVFMVARLSPLFELAPVALSVVIVIGGLTAFFAATVGLVQNDIKRVVAYSTCSQLGYMFVALGSGGYAIGVYHLFTHAFFKALLFLGAGSVIHAMHHEQDIRKMGGLWKKIPITAAMMLVGTLALTGFPFTAGFFSKDAIIEAAYATKVPGHDFAFMCVILAAGMTSFYSWRLFFLTFMGKTRADHHTYDHAHESPMVMLVPLFVLAAGAILAGFPLKEAFIGHGHDAFWKGALGYAKENHVMHDFHEVPKWVVFAPLVMMTSGFLLACYMYLYRPEAPKRLASEFPGIHRFLLNKWYFDELYDLIFVRPAKWVGRFLWKQGDGRVIDGFGPDGVSATVVKVTGRVVKLQTGYVYNYAFAMLIGVAGLVSWYLAGGFR
ncbi:MAG: NADH-quinone oxidoreductase subunit L [Beijerinckiaceae bacterium]